MPSSRHHYSLRLSHRRTKLLHREFTSLIYQFNYFICAALHCISRPFTLQPRQEEEKEGSKSTLPELIGCPPWLPNFLPRLVLSRAQTIPSGYSIVLFSTSLAKYGVFSTHYFCLLPLLSCCSTYTGDFTRPPISSSSHTPHTRTLGCWFSSSFFSFLFFFRLAPPLVLLFPIKSNPNVPCFAFLFRDKFVPRAL